MYVKKRKNLVLFLVLTRPMWCDNRLQKEASRTHIHTSEKININTGLVIFFNYMTQIGHFTTFGNWPESKNFCFGSTKIIIKLTPTPFRRPKSTEATDLTHGRCKLSHVAANLLLMFLIMGHFVCKKACSYHTTFHTEQALIARLGPG